MYYPNPLASSHLTHLTQTKYPPHTYHHRSLGTDLPAEFEDITSDLTEPRVEQVRSATSDLTEVYNTRTAAVTQLVLDCQHLISELCIEAENSEFDRKIMGSINQGGSELSSTFSSETCTGINATAFEELTTRVGELNAEKRRRKQKVSQCQCDTTFINTTFINTNTNLSLESSAQRSQCCGRN